MECEKYVRQSRQMKPTVEWAVGQVDNGQRVES